MSISVPGYAPLHMRLERRLSGWFWGNVLLGGGGVVGMFVDSRTGAMFQLRPAEAALPLGGPGQPLVGRAGSGAPGLHRRGAALQDALVVTVATGKRRRRKEWVQIAQLEPLAPAASSAAPAPGASGGPEVEPEAGPEAEPEALPRP